MSPSSSADAVARELDSGELEEPATSGGRRERSWHVVARMDGELPPTARLFLDHLTAAAAGPNRFHRAAASEQTGSCQDEPLAGLDPRLGDGLLSVEESGES